MLKGCHAEDSALQPMLGPERNTKSMGLMKSLSGFGNIKKEVKPNDPHKIICDN